MNYRKLWNESSPDEWLECAKVLISPAGAEKASKLKQGESVPQNLDSSSSKTGSASGSLCSTWGLNESRSNGTIADISLGEHRSQAIIVC